MMNEIITTIGPASFDPRIILQLKYAGATCFRINLSHSNPELDNFPSLRGGIEPLVGGDEILTRLDIEPGPLLGEIKKWLVRIQVENDLADSSSVWNTAESLGFKGEPIGEYRMWV